MEKEKPREFEVQARLVLLTTLTVSAKSLEEAMAKAGLLQERDFVEFAGDYIDGSMRITGIFESSTSL